MSAPSSHTPLLADRLWQAQSTVEQLARSVALILLGTIALYISAKVKIPFYPVPATLQSLVVVLIGAFYGPRLAFATVAVYLAECAFGLPVTTASTAGLAYMMGPTGGYLIGFLAMAPLVGLLVERGVARSIAGALGVALLANVVLYAFGLTWLAMAFGIEKAVAAGLLPFLYSDAVKMVLAASVMAATTRALTR